MRLKTIPIQTEDRFLTVQDAHKLWREIYPEQCERFIIAIEGAPGTGKSILANNLKRVIKSTQTEVSIEVSIVETDLDCLPWSERPANSSLMDWHKDTLSKEVIKHPGAEFTYTGYDPVSHERTQTKLITSPKNGVLILEGLHSTEFACRFTNQPVVSIVFQISNELREIRRAERNVRQGRWKPEEVESRTAAQRESSINYYSDLYRELARSSINIHNTIRKFH